MGFFAEKNSLFIDKGRFKPSEPGLLIYESKEKPFFLFFSIGFLGGVGYFTYKAVQDFQANEDYVNMLMSMFMVGSFALMQWRINKSLKSVYLDVGGKSALMEFYRFGGASSKCYVMDNKYLKGVGLLYPALLKNYKVPVIHYKTEKRKGYFFFKMFFIKDVVIFRQTILGKEFIVSDEPALNLKVSKKSKNAYKL